MSGSATEEYEEDVVLLTTVYSQPEASVLEATLNAYGIPYLREGNIMGAQHLGCISFYVAESVAEDAAALLAISDEAH